MPEATTIMGIILIIFAIIYATFGEALTNKKKSFLDNYNDDKM